MFRLVMGGMRTTARRCSRPLNSGACGRSNWLGPPIGDQRQQIRFEPLAVFRRVSQQQLDQPALPCTKMPMHSAACEPMEKFNRLFGENPFEFFSGHECARSLSWKFFQHAPTQCRNRLGGALRQRRVRVP